MSTDAGRSERGRKTNAVIPSTWEQHLLDQVSIRRLINDLARSVDRGHVKAIAGCLSPAAIVDDPPLGFRGDGRGFAKWVGEQCGKVVTMATHITNFVVEVHDDRAAAESYAITIEVDLDGRIRWRSGRYLDLLLRTGAGWKVAGRQYVALLTYAWVPRGWIRGGTPPDS
jgi:ketosteroid isomerase-like protein